MSFQIYYPTPHKEVIHSETVSDRYDGIRKLLGKPPFRIPKDFDTNHPPLEDMTLPLFKQMFSDEQMCYIRIYGADAVNRQLFKKVEKPLVIINWDILPPGTWARNQAAQVLQSIPEQERTTDTVAALKERFDFYESLKPSAVTEINSNKFRGYFGAIFSSGVIMLERLLYGNAIYIMPATDWLEFTKLTKFEASQKPGVKRILHNGNWKKRVEKIVLDKPSQK